VFNVGPEKLILLLVIALVVLGPQRLPGAARSLGRAVAELRRLSGNLQQEVHGALGDSGEAFTDAVNTLRGGLGSVFTVSDDAGPAQLTAPAGPSRWSAAAPDPRALPTRLPETLPTPDDPSLN
jgi:Tat protein translocase TatB subunit